MLKKVFYYEVKALLRPVLIFCAVMLALGGVGVVMTILLRTEGNDGTYTGVLFEFLPTIAALTLALCMFGISVLAAVGCVYLVYRYYRSCYTDEGYLTFALPVSAKTLLWGKLLAAFLFQILLGLFAILSYAIVASFGIGEALISSDLAAIFRQIPDVFLAVSDFLSPSPILTAVEGLILFFGVMLTQLSLLYFCVALASVIFKKIKLLGSILVYFGVSFLSGVFVRLLTTGWLIGMERIFRNEGNSVVIMQILLVGLILLEVLIFFATYLPTKHIMQKKLNLE